LLDQDRQRHGVEKAAGVLFQQFVLPQILGIHLKKLGSRSSGKRSRFPGEKKKLGHSLARFRFPAPDASSDMVGMGNEVGEKSEEIFELTPAPQMVPRVKSGTCTSLHNRREILCKGKIVTESLKYS
jgi:hypothetical protein